MQVSSYFYFKDSIVMDGVVAIVSIFLAIAAPFIALNLLGKAILGKHRVTAFNTFRECFLCAIFCTVAFCAWASIFAEQMLVISAILVVFGALFTLSFFCHPENLN
jgi:hypothetical protein